MLPKQCVGPAVTKDLPNTHKPMKHPGVVLRVPEVGGQGSRQAWALSSAQPGPTGLGASSFAINGLRI